MKEFKKIEEYESVLYSFNSSSEQGRYGLEEMCISEFGEENFKKEFNICDGKGDDGVDAYGRLKEGNDTVLYIIQSSKSPFTIIFCNNIFFFLVYKYISMCCGTNMRNT